MIQPKPKHKLLKRVAKTGVREFHKIKKVVKRRKVKVVMTLTF